MGSEEEVAYRVQAEAGKFQVMDDTGHIIMVCHDQGSATHYVVLLNEAFHRGYKAGYRAARQNTS